MIYEVISLIEHITTFNISIVVHGTVAESNTLLPGETNPYAVPKRMGIFCFLESPKSLTTSCVGQMIERDDFRKSYKEVNPDAKGVTGVAKEGGEK
ncbi:ethanolamine-phosphate cytidylyltransferase-like [Hibiscus syriacus]|uniref:ethanolamine-phosphate cytidylyltransferase-like n=1 Tax=Hibiscus syriacus TaxID=106335 RepID=UPI001923F5F5|nr:ethanolamine-phosphate cytidylyltransferase-like [Hibiscus syriacus]XP_039054473.1 ethanolamine-phosphate cytidylyltransferase-like [Hibiscus syriacus]